MLKKNVGCSAVVIGSRPSGRALIQKNKKLINIIMYVNVNVNE